MITPKHKYNIPTIYVQGVQEDTKIKGFVHCYVNERVPIGRRKLWGIEYPIKPIDVRNVVSSDLLLELATIEPDEEIGERIVSRILFKSIFAITVFKRMLSIEIQTRTGVKPLLLIRAFNQDLETAFEELCWLIDGYEGMMETPEGKVQLDSRIFHPHSRPSHTQNNRVMQPAHHRHVLQSSER